MRSVSVSHLFRQSVPIDQYQYVVRYDNLTAERPRGTYYFISLLNFQSHMMESDLNNCYATTTNNPESMM